MLSRPEKANRGSLRVYKSYNFVDKDPVIDYCRTKVFTESADKQYGGGPAKVARDSGVSPATLYNWFKGKTKRPQFSTVAAVLLACGESKLDLRKINRNK